jgi:nicotinamide mononucleotide transporter
MSGLEIVGAVTGIISVWLTTRQNIWCWPIGLVNLAVYALVFHSARLYADMALQGIYAALAVWGWYCWLRGGKEGAPLRVSQAPVRVYSILFPAGILCSLALGLGLERATDAAVPFWDAATTTFSLAATFMQTRKWFENWIVWIVVDSCLVGKYAWSGLWPTAGLFFIFTILAVMGLMEWRRSLKMEGAR